ncbi:MAG: STAS domain-containing protein [Methylococcales bacterium]|nr:STAS domain-containing protein [Methylococcales bacterium]
MTTKENDRFDPLAWMNDDVIVEEPEKKLEAIVKVKSEKGGDDIESELITDDSNELVKQDDKPTEDSMIILDATLTIQNVSALYESLLKRLNTQNIIEIDASSVISIDTSTLQLLSILKQTGIHLQKEVVIDFPSDAFIKSAELLGVSELLEVNNAASGLF